MSSVRINTLFFFLSQTYLYPKGMHCKGMHLTFCYAELELAWQKDVLEILNVICAARWCFSPSRIEHFFFSFPPFVCVHCCVFNAPAKGRTNMELREKFILADGASQGMAAFRPRGRRSRPSSRGASPNRSTSVSSQAAQAASPQVPATSTPKVGLGHETFSSCVQSVA